MKNLVMAYKNRWGKKPDWHTVKEYGLDNINKAYFKLDEKGKARLIGLNSKPGFYFYKEKVMDAIPESMRSAAR